MRRRAHQMAAAAPRIEHKTIVNNKIKLVQKPTK